MGIRAVRLVRFYTWLHSVKKALFCVVPCLQSVRSAFYQMEKPLVLLSIDKGNMQPVNMGLLNQTIKQFVTDDCLLVGGRILCLKHFLSVSNQNLSHFATPRHFFSLFKSQICCAFSDSSSRPANNRSVCREALIKIPRQRTAEHQHAELSYDFGCGGFCDNECLKYKRGIMLFHLSSAADQTQKCAQSAASYTS